MRTPTLIVLALLALMGYSASAALLMQDGAMHADWATVLLLLLPSRLRSLVALIVGSLLTRPHAHRPVPHLVARPSLRGGNRVSSTAVPPRRIPVQGVPARSSSTPEEHAQEESRLTGPAHRQTRRSDGTDAPILQVEKLTKRFGGVLAIDEVSLSVFPGEVVGLLGDNGAGKSTLIKLIAGVYRPDDGSITFNGALLHHASPLEVREHGIETIYQDLALCENLDAPTNIFLGREPTRRLFGVVSVVDRARMQQEARTLLARLDIHLPDLGMPVQQFSGGQRQAVAIARALSWNARLLIMDEPTAALGVPEQRKVLDLVCQLRREGIAVILISHTLQDVFATASRVIVLRRGKHVGERAVAETDRHELVAMMVGACD